MNRATTSLPFALATALAVTWAPAALAEPAPAKAPPPAGAKAPAPAGKAAPATADVKPPGKGDLTTAEAVLEASITAQGGRERIAKVKTMRQTGWFSLPQLGVKGAMTMTASPPHNLRVLIDLPGLGKILRGSGDGMSWEMDPMSGARLLKGDELAQSLRDSDFRADLNWKQHWPKAELAGIVEYGGGPAYKVVLTAADGDSQTRYISKATLLPAGAQAIARTQGGQVPTESLTLDWRDVGGIKYPHKVVQKAAGQTFEIVIDKIERDAALDAQAFALPPEIAALKSKAGGAAPAPAGGAAKPAAPAKTPAPAPAKTPAK